MVLREFCHLLPVLHALKAASQPPQLVGTPVPVLQKDGGSERSNKYLPEVGQLEELGLDFKTTSVCLSV